MKSKIQLAVLFCCNLDCGFSCFFSSFTTLLHRSHVLPVHKEDKKNKPIFFLFFLFHRSHLPVHKEDGSCGGKKDEPEPQEDVDLKIFIVCPFASLTVNLVEMVLSCSSPFH